MDARYRTRTTLIGVIVAGALLFAAMQWGWPLLRHQMALSRIRAAGGEVLFDDQAAMNAGYETWRRAQNNLWLAVVQVELASDAEVLAVANDLPSLSKFDELSFGSEVTDASLERLSQVKPPLKLKAAEFINSPVTDIDAMTHFESVECLFFNTVALTDDGLQGLPKIRGLKSLFMIEENPRPDPFRYTDRGFRAIGRIPGLESLTLINYRIDEASTRSLGGLQHLRKLYISRCIIEDRAAVDLKAALPYCVIRIENCHAPTP